MKYVPVPLALLAVGEPLPVNLWSPGGQLLLRKEQALESEQHRERLAAHGASTTESDALAWQRAYERRVRALLRAGADAQSIEAATLPSTIDERDYGEHAQVLGGWLDLQEMLRGILYQGGLAINPLPRLQAIADQACALLQADADDTLLVLLQALGDTGLSYCATQALLAMVVCELTATKLQVGAGQRQSLRSAALTMNIGMAREQDSLARQAGAPSAWQRALVHEHPQRSAQLLAQWGVDDADWLDLVRTHRAPSTENAALQTAHQVLAIAESFIAKMAARRTRAAVAPLKAVKSMVLEAEGDAIGIGSAMAQAVGFYPPGSYVQLQNGETALCVRRGERANTPWVLPILDKSGMPLSRYVCRDTAQSAFAIQAPVPFQAVKLALNLERVRKARDRLAA